jgi:succinate dehydrogenase hydrophobic anchor subunit
MTLIQIINLFIGVASIVLSFYVSYMLGKLVTMRKMVSREEFNRFKLDFIKANQALALMILMNSKKN